MLVPKKSVRMGREAAVTRRKFVAATVGGIGGFAAASVAAPAAFAADTTHPDNVYIGGPSPWVDVRAMGAAGDGVTNDTAAIQAAVNHLGDAGGRVFFPIGTYKITSTVFLHEGTCLVGFPGGLDIPGNLLPGSRIDASAVTTSTAFQGPGNNAGARFTDLVIIGPAAAAAANGVTDNGYFGSVAINPGDFAASIHFENLWIKGFSNGIVLPYTHDVTLDSVLVDNARNHCLTVIGGLSLSVFGSAFSNAGFAGSEGTEANVYFRKLSGDTPSHMWFIGSFVDETAGNEAASIFVRDGESILLEGMTVLTSSHNAVGVRIGDGTSSPTRVTLSSVRIEPYHTNVPRWALQIMPGAVDTALINVSAQGGATGNSISDQGTRTRWINTNDKTKLATAPPLPVGTDNDVGTADTLAVSDHVHSGLVKEGVQHSTFVGSFGSAVKFAFFVARVPGKLLGYHLLSKNRILASDAAYWTISLQHRDAAGNLRSNYGTKTTRVSGGQGIAPFAAWGPGESPLNLQAGDSLVFSAVKTGTPPSVQSAGLTIYWEPD
ncbi:MAG: glycosyl hydrolase family 28-related protein [Actinomycetota bacterium]